MNAHHSLLLTTLRTQLHWHTVKSVTSDSRNITPGAVFVAISGTKQDGHQFIDDAFQKGAVAAIVSKKYHPLHRTQPIFAVEDTRLALSELAAEFYHHPSHQLKMIGITGTSGKTTSSYLLESILSACGEKVGILGTVNIRFGEKVYGATHTTPDAADIHRLLSEMKAQGCTAVVMEVSSHSLAQKRVAHIAFDGGLFTNLSPEHQDYHPNMDDYFQAKSLLFTESLSYSAACGKNMIRVANGEDPYGQRLLGSEFFHLSRQNLTVSLNGIHGFISSDSRQNIFIESSLSGRFNAENVLGAVTLAQAMRFPASGIRQGVSNLKTVPGRLERVYNARGIHVFVDYAHKPDALEKVLLTLRESLPPGAKLITVFGCGGDRDRKKRPVMGKLSTQLSDFSWITSDNPRTENPQAIILEVVSGIDSSKPHHVEADRKKAIEGALTMARPGDVVLIAGKGHEDYQIIADPQDPQGVRKIHFDDREIAADFFTK